MKIYKLDCTLDNHICVVARDTDEFKEHLAYAMDELVADAENYLRNIKNYNITIDEIQV